MVMMVMVMLIWLWKHYSFMMVGELESIVWMRHGHFVSYWNRVSCK